MAAKRSAVLTARDLARRHVAKNELAEVPPPVGWPDGITICGTRWPIVYVLNAPAWYGLTDINERWILMAISGGEERMRQTLTHEILHAIIHAAHVELKHKAEERLVSVGAEMLHDVLTRNAPWWK